MLAGRGRGTQETLYKAFKRCIKALYIKRAYYINAYMSCALYRAYRRFTLMCINMAYGIRHVQYICWNYCQLKLRFSGDAFPGHFFI